MIVPFDCLAVYHHNTDDGQVRKITVTAAWQNIESATYAQCTVAGVALGSAGFYEITRPAGLDAAVSYPVTLYAPAATNFSDAPLSRGEDSVSDENLEAILAVAEKYDTMVEEGEDDNYVFTTEALAAAPGASGFAVLSDSTGTRFTSTGGTIINLEVAQNSTTTLPFFILDAVGGPVSMAGKEIRFVVHDEYGSVTFVLSTLDVPSRITVGGDDDNEIEVEIYTDKTVVTPYSRKYVLWNYTDRDPLAAGVFTIKVAPIAAS